MLFVVDISISDQIHIIGSDSDWINALLFAFGLGSDSQTVVGLGKSDRILLPSLPILRPIPACPPALPNSPIFLPLHVPPSWCSPPSYMTNALHSPFSPAPPHPPYMPYSTCPYAEYDPLDDAEYDPLCRASNSLRTLWTPVLTGRVFLNNDYAYGIHNNR